MRKYITENGTFYYPELYLNLIDTEEVKIIVENPVGYVEGDSVRLLYTFALFDNQVGVNTFEMFSPLVKDGAILRAIFYLPLSVEFTIDRISFTYIFKQTHYFIKTKGSTDFTNSVNVLDTKYSNIYLTTRAAGVQSTPIPVFFFSERGAGLFANKILNRQSWVADTNFSSVAIRQDKFNPFDMEIGGRNLLLGTTTGEGWQYSTFEDGVFTRSTTETSEVFLRSIEQTDLERNTKYTLSAWIKSNGYVRHVDFWVYNKGAVNTHAKVNIPAPSDWEFVSFTFTTADADYSETTVRFDNNGSISDGTLATLYVKMPKLEEGSIATAYTPNPEDYEVTEVVSGSDLAGGLAKFNSSYAFKLLDDSEWVTKKLICPENYIQLFWGEPRTETRFSFWFKIKEIEKSSEAWGEVEHYRELRAGTDVKERRKEVTKYRFPKTKLRLTSGVFRQDIIDKLKGIAHSPTIFKYNPYTKLNEGRGVVAQVTKLERVDGVPITQLGTGHFKLNYPFTTSNTIAELVNSPESVFDLEFTVKGFITGVYFRQNRDDSSKAVLISGNINEPNFTKKTFNASITIDRSRKVKPVLTFDDAAPFTEIKDIYIKGNLGGIEDVEVEIATMNIIPHQDGESEMELTVISDDFRKPDYLYF